MKEMYKLFFYFVIIGGLMCGLCDRAFAEDKDDVTFNLEQVVVTATRTAKQLKDVPGTVEVITKEDLERKQVKRISDVLKLLPGVYIREPKGLMGNSDAETISMRGFISSREGDQYIVFLLDGQPINDGNKGAVNLSNIPVETIERIEVIKGASSALYGSNAMGGVINIITQEKPDDATTIKLTVGEMGTRIGSINNSGSAGKLDYFLYAKKAEADGYVSQLDYLTAKPNSDKARYPGKNGMDSESYNARFVYHFDDKSDLSINIGKNNHSYFWENKNDIGDRDEDMISLSYKNDFDERNSFRISYSQKKEDKIAITTSTSPVTNNITSYYAEHVPSKIEQIELQHDYRLSSKDLLTIGYAYKTQKADLYTTILNPKSNGRNWGERVANSDNDSGAKTENQAVYIQNEHKFNEMLTLYLGVRYDRWRFVDGYQYKYDAKNQTYGYRDLPDLKESNVSPKVALVYQANDKLTLRASAGKAFRAPNIIEMLGEYYSDKNIILANPNLESEESMNYEVGADYQFDKNLFARATVFYSSFDHFVTDQITRDPKNPERNISQKINIDESKIKGIELSLDKTWDEHWSGFVNYTFTDAKIKKSSKNPEMIGNKINYVPENMFNIGVNYQNNGWQSSLIGNYVSDPYDDMGKEGYGSYDSYFVFDFRLSYALDDDTKIAFNIDNVFDREYYSYYLAQPRTAYLEFSKRF